VKIYEQPINIVRKFYEKYPVEDARKKASSFMAVCEAKPLEYFCPNVVQERVIKAVDEATSEAQIATILMTSGNGVGKTTISLQVLANLIYGKQNDWFEGEIYRKYPYPRTGWLITTPANIEENYFNPSSETSFYNKFRNHEVEYEKKGKTHVSYVNFKDANFQLNVKTFNQDVSEFESVTLGLVIIDEPCPQNIWKTIPARLRKGGIILMPMTPLDVDPYVVSEVVNLAADHEKGYRHIVGDAWEVTEEKPRGHYKTSVLEDQISRMDSDEVQARIHGEVNYFRERIYPSLDNDIHYVNPEDYPLKENYLYYHVVDPHDGRPNAEIWAAKTPEGRIIVFYERPESQDVDFWELRGGEDIDTHIPKVLFAEEKLSKLYGFRINPERYFDRHFAVQTRGTKKTSLVDDYMEKGWSVNLSYEAQNEVEYGHQKVRQMLNYLPDGKPGLVIYKNCYHAWNGLTHYIRRRPRTAKDMERAVGTGKIIEKFKDLPDCIRMLCCIDTFEEGETDYKYNDLNSALDYI